MEAVGRVFSGKRVFVTGHTGFKGSWLCEWLLSLGASVTGFGLGPPTSPALFNQLSLGSRLEDLRGDVRDAAALEAAIARVQPDVVFHLAAQSLVRRSYAVPLETFATNTMGTANLLSGLRLLKKPCAVVVVTTDKCYQNLEQGRHYQEGDALGGHDPYSGSKAAAEIVTGSWRDSFYSPQKILDGAAAPVAIATARAGNVIGGGDWASERILPDCWRSLSRSEPIRVRNPSAVRPWQHVLESIGGYLQLAAQLHGALSEKSPRLEALCSGFNFGPVPADHRSVAELVEEVLKHWPGTWEDCSDPKSVHEALLLHLSTEKAERLIGWRPRWNFSESVARAVTWHRAPAEGLLELTRRQIADYAGGLPQ